MASCSSIKYVPEDQYLLDKYKLKVDAPGIRAKELNPYVRPEPNKKILGTKFHLRLYNLSGEKDNGINRWLRRIGEEPVLYDPYQKERNNEQLGLYLRNKGYYYSTVLDTVEFKRGKALLSYDITAGRPYRIRKISYNLEDTTLNDLILPDSVNSLLHTGDLFDVDMMQQERNRIQERLRNNGYYNFSKEYLYYEVDSALNSFQVDLVFGIRKFVQASEDGYFDQVPHRKYHVDKVYIYPEFDPQQAITDYQGYIEGMNQLEYSGFDFLFEGDLRANAGIISQSVFIIPGEMYDYEKVRQSHQHLSSLRIYRLVNILFEEAELSDSLDYDTYPLVCHIQLSPATLQSATVGLEGTNSSGNIGMEGNLNYQHRNVFGGAENFRFRVSGAVETIREVEEAGYGNMIELGGEAGINIPKFLLPFKTEQFIRKFNPKTNISVAYNYQRRPDYTRSVFNTTFGYIWRGNDFTTHIVNPLQLNFVEMVDASTDFIDSIQDTYLRYSFEDRLILGTSYTWIYSNQDIQKAEDFVYLRTYLASSGLLMSGISNAASLEQDSLGRYSLLGNEYAQYVKGEVEFRYFNYLDDKSSIIYRLFCGVAYPYGNSITIPYEKQYFSGGANGIRAWQVRNLGPGSYRGFTSRYPNTTADIKLEANLEYRFKLFWVLEGALFVDAGNIWSITPEDEREGAEFAWNKFYKEIAVGTGLGLRMDFSFFIFRFDLGLQARDPAEPEGSRWVLLNLPMRTPQINIAIGYPF
jgi:outer membrane protein assembly factor BamA